VLAAGEALAEAAGGAGWVAEDDPEDLGVGIGQGSLGGFPDDVGDGGGLVHDEDDALALVVEAGESLGVTFSDQATMSIRHVRSPIAREERWR
jgi:hypothetical protein